MARERNRMGDFFSIQMNRSHKVFSVHGYGYGAFNAAFVPELIIELQLSRTTAERLRILCYCYALWELL